MGDTRWTVLLPLKGGAGAKSRLGAPQELATAIALDCLAAVLAAPSVARTLVVTPDRRMAAAATGLGAQVLPERAPSPGTGASGEPTPVSSLLAAIGTGLARATGPTAVLLGDLPALHSDDLDAALAACSAHLTAFVPDATGDGTVLLAGRRPGALVPRFGPDSAALHAAGGAVRLDLDLPRLRRDVDTPADLEAAVKLGLGSRTSSLLGL